MTIERGALQTNSNRQHCEWPPRSRSLLSQSGGKPPHSKRFAPSSASGEIAERVDCGGLPPLFISRFMGSKDARFGAYWDHEPQICKCLRINETIGRFMERMGWINH